MPDTASILAVLSASPGFLSWRIITKRSGGFCVAEVAEFLEVEIPGKKTISLSGSIKTSWGVYRQRTNLNWNRFIMLLFGHIGITLGVVYLVSRYAPVMRGKINYWFIALGAILPDMIDKMIGRVLFADTIANGRLIAHTLLFTILLILLGTYIYKVYSRFGVLCISCAAFLHLVEDAMWNAPGVLLWPLYGPGFQAGIPYEHWYDYFLMIFTNSYTPRFSYVFISETIGLIIIMLFIFQYLRSKIQHIKEE